MRFYHGTATTFEDDIRQKGLIPIAHNRLKVLNESGEPLPYPNDNAVYLTKSRATAEKFATFRAAYERAQQGEIILFSPVPVPVEFQSFFGEEIGIPNAKIADTIDANAEPLIVALDIPPTISLVPDDDSAESYKAYWTTQAIPASAIVRMIHPK